MPRKAAIMPLLLLGVISNIKQLFALSAAYRDCRDSVVASAMLQCTLQAQ